MAGNNLVLEFLARLMTRTAWGNIPKETLQKAVDRIDQFVPRFHKLIEEIAQDEVVPMVFPTWRRVTLGTFPTVEKMVEALEAQGFKLSDWARDILTKVSLTPVTVELELVRVSVAELGFPKGATRQEIYDRAATHGLVPVPSEVGPQLRLQYADQPPGEWLRIAMDPIAVSDGDLRVFCVEHGDGGRWLRACSGHPAYRWNPDNVWVFARRKQ